MTRIGIAAALGAVGLMALTGCTADKTAPPDTAAASSTSVAQQPVQDEPSATGSGVGGDSDGSPSGGTSVGGTDDGGNSDGTGIAACTAADITPTLGDITPSDTQTTVPLRYTNSGSVPCNVTGYPGATLEGPGVDGLGPDYDLPRSETTPSTTITLEPGAAAVADLTLGTVNKNDARAWIPTGFLTTAPGDTTVMTLPFPASVGVQRQDGATRPASYISAFRGPVG